MNCSRSSNAKPRGKSKLRWTRRELKIMSWNINSMVSNGTPKHHDPETMRLFNEHDIVCLQETRDDVPVPNFESFASIRLSKRSGGVAILVKQGILEGVKAIEVPNPDITALKLDGEFFGLAKNTVIINTYARPENSSGRHIKSGEETIADCEELISELQGDYAVLLVGDFNARIGNDPCQAAEGEIEHVPVPTDYTPDSINPRCSQDNMVNKQGRFFKNLVMNTQMTILNGRTLGDFSGYFTSIQYNGCAVVDYIVATNDLIASIDHMRVRQLIATSDHRPLSTQVQCQPFTTQPDQALTDRFQLAPARFLVKPENKEAFKHAMSSQDVIEGLDRVGEKLKEGGALEAYGMFQEHIQSLCKLTLSATNPTKAAKAKHSKPWHTDKIRNAKRLLDKATRLADRFPTTESIRKNFYRIKGSYKRLTKNSRARYEAELNTNIESGKALNWQAFEKLKRSKTNSITSTVIEMERFQTFFKDLYADSHPSLTVAQKEEMLAEADIINNQAENQPLRDTNSMAREDLNAPLVTEEIAKSIKALKSGKAAGDDQIPNEVLKMLDPNHLEALCNIFNACFDSGKYPWTRSIITPLHKKGPRSDPDNYRAVAVSSAIGKLLSSILLLRLTKFRSAICPDPPNQLGFRKDCQTTDHIFTLMTLAQKYKKLGKTIYAVFVDYRKAFDSVPRQALFLKLAKLGITGKFYNILKSMYSSSVAQIKLSGHLSKEFSVRKGTEQGHPLSPELFKIFLFELSEILDTLNDPNDTPSLRHLRVSHLLFADDLILLALNKRSAQRQVDALVRYCKSWGLEINQSKTKLLVLGKHQVEGPPLQLDENSFIEQAKSYCYLGIKVTDKGDFSTACREDLNLKATRALYALKRNIRRDKLSLKAQKQLFTALIKPILLYGAPIWTPLSRPTKKLITADTRGSNLLRTLAEDKAERLQLSYLKWCLGINKYAPNAATWGDTDSYPLSLDAISMTTKYLRRVKGLDKTTFANAAYHEQKNLALPWYKSLRQLLERDPLYKADPFLARAVINGERELQDDHYPDQWPARAKGNYIPSREFRVPLLIQTVQQLYTDAWTDAVQTSRKLEFYRKIQHSPGLPPYTLTKYKHRRAMAQLRTSTHCLLIETGRHKNIMREDRHCPSCKLTMGEELIESETHALDVCDLYSTERQELLESIRKDPDNSLPNQTSSLTRTPVTHLIFDTSTHSPRTVGLIARFVAAVLDKRARWESIASSNALSQIDSLLSSIFR